MKNPAENRYLPHEFARRSGVTVRTLHHYDRIGLLKPGDHTGTGFRVYRDRDFARLQQVVTLKFIGFSLKEIKGLLERRGVGLAAALRTQRATLEEKRRRMELAIQAIARAERLAADGSEPDWEAFQRITKEIQMQTNNDWARKYYNDEAGALIAERQKLWNPELQKRAENDWGSLYKDIEAAAAAGLDPAGPEARALADRHHALVGAFTGGHAAIRDGLDKMWKDQANWPAEFKQGMVDTFASQGTPGAAASVPCLLTPPADEFWKQALAAFPKPS